MEPQDRMIAWLLAGLVAAPILFLVALSTVDLVIDLGDPCTEWGTADRPDVRLDDTCPRRSGHSATRIEAVVSHVGFQGTLAFGAVAGLVAVSRHASVHAALGAAALLFVAVPLSLSLFGPLTILLALLLYFLARWIRARAPPREEERPVARAALVILAAVWALVIATVFRIGWNPVFLVGFAFAVGLGALVVMHHWPRAPPATLPP